MRFLPLIILQVLVLFTLRAHAVERKPSQKPSSTTYYVTLGKLIHFSVFSLSAYKHRPDSYWWDNARKPLSICLIDGQQMVVITLWINNEERRKSDTALLLENTLFTYNVYIQVRGIIYMYQKMAFLTKIGEWGLETLGGGKHFWNKKKVIWKIFLLSCHLNKTHFLCNSVHYSSIRIKFLEIMQCCLQYATEHYFYFV